MRTLFTILICLILPFSASAADPYDNQYCKDPVQLQQWSKILTENPDSDAVAALHALWVGLCVQVEMHSLTTNRAQKIFEDFKLGIIGSVQNQADRTDKKSGV
jgi:hypothetical protein